MGGHTECRMVRFDILNVALDCLVTSLSNFTAELYKPTLKYSMEVKATPLVFTVLNPADHLLTLTHTYWTNMYVFNSRNLLKMNESHIIQICTWLFQKYLLWLHILLSFEYSGFLLRSERITWTCSSLSYCCHIEPALKESQGRCPPKVNYLLHLGANYILEIAENTGNLSKEKKIKGKFLVFKKFYKNSHSSLTHSLLWKWKDSFFSFLPCLSLPLYSFPLAKCRNGENKEGWKKIFVATRKSQVKQII